jgi:transcriptional regulator with XRE-family HTH domain
MNFENENLIFGQTIKEIRVSRKMSIRALAVALGVSPVYLSDLENSSRKVTSTVIEKVKSSLELSEDEEAKVMSAFSHDRLDIPVELLYYLIDNDLLDSLKTIQKEDSKGESIKCLALKFKQSNVK